MRSSNCDEGLNFHFLMMVHRTATPPMLAPMTIRTVIVVCFPAPLEGAAVGVEEAAAAAAVLVTKTDETLWTPKDAEGIGLTLRVGAVLEEDEEVVKELDEDEDVLDDELVVVVVAVVVNDVVSLVADTEGEEDWDEVKLASVVGATVEAGSPVNVAVGLEDVPVAGSPPAPTTGTNGSVGSFARSMKGERFLIKRLRLPWRRFTEA
jgi:hypothetical protein